MRQRRATNAHAHSSLGHDECVRKSLCWWNLVRLIILLEFDHSFVVLQVGSYSLQHVQFFHCSSEVDEFFMDPFYDRVCLVHRLGLRVFDAAGGFIVCWLTTRPFSVTEEKGEGFENGKKSHWLCGCLQPWPSSTS